METLAEQLAVYRAVADASYDWEEWVDENGQLRYISPACRRITGYNPEEFLTNPRLGEEIVHPDDQALYTSYLDQVVKGPAKSLEIEYRIIHHNAEVRRIALGSQPVYGPNNEFLGQRISYRDVTDRKLTEEELRQSHQLIDALINGLMEVVAVTDPDGNILLANRVMAQRLEMNLGELVGKNISDVLPPEIAEIRKRIGKKVIQTGNVIRVQEKGKAGLYDSIYHPLVDEKGKVEKVAVLSYDMTELKKIEEELRKSEERFRNIYEQSPIGIELYDEKGRLLDVNRACLDIFGVTDMAEVRGFDLFKDPNLPEEAKKRLFEGEMVRYESAFDFEKVKTQKLYDTRHSGMIYLDVQITPLNGVGSSHPVKYLVQVQDITESKQAGEALQRSEQLLRTVINNAPVIIAAIDNQGVITLAEGKSPAAVGFKAGDLVGKNAFELISDLPEGGKQLKRIMEGEEFSDQYKSKQGAVFEFRYKPVFDQQSNFAGAIMVAVDVTGYTRAQEELRQAKNQLEIILDGVADSISVINPEGRLIYANQVAARRVGYSSVEAMIKDDKLYDYLEYFDQSGEPLPDNQRPGNLLLNGVSIPSKTFHYRVRGTHEDRWVAISATPVFDNAGKAIMSVIISHDISEIKQTQLELQKAHQELEQRIEERTSELAQANSQLREEVEMRKQAETTIRQKAAHSEALARVAARINAKLDLKSVLQAICKETASTINFSGCAIMLFYEERDCFEVVANTLGFTPDRVASISREQYEGFLEAFGSVLVIPDISNMQNAPHPELAAIRQTRTIVGVPLSHDGRLVGNLNLYSLGEIHLPTEDEISLLKGFADQASIAIANARLFEQISESNIRLQALSERLVKIQEEERRMLARELHDEIGQMLTSLSLNCDIILKSLKEDDTDLPKITLQFDRSKQLVNQLVTQIRKLSLELRPGILDDLGLLPALLDHFERFTSQTNIKVQFKHHGLEGRYSTDVEITAFRIVQEALTNTARHAKVDNVSVHLWVDRGLLKLKVEDQGIGFDLEAVERTSTSVGISSMRERAILCGGELEIETLPGRGTCLTAELPLDINSTRSENVHYDTARR